VALRIDRHTLRRLRPFVPAAIIIAIACFIAWAFAVTTLHYAGPMGLPLDDSYIYLTYAKQFGRAQPFTYYPGGGYSAGSTSVLWPMLLAPFWTLGARGHALVWVSFDMCAALYALVGVGVYRFVRLVQGSEIAGMLAAIATLVIAPFAWCSLSGMEVAFAAALLVGTLLLLLRQPPTGPPKKLLVACLAAASLSRPEAMLLVGGIVGIAIIQRLRQRDFRAAAWWLLPLGPPILWLLANRIIAGNFFPNTGVAKSHFYLPGFDWTYWLTTVRDLSGRMLRGLFWDKTSPLVWPRLILVLVVAGNVRVGIWAWREKKLLVGAIVIVAPFLMMLAVIASSGLWNFQNYRYIAPAFPLLMIPVGIALSPPMKHVWLRRAWLLAATMLIFFFARAARPPLIADMKLFAQGAMDSNSQVVAIGNYIHKKLPHARIMFHDAGAIAYYGDGEVYDMLGLVTNHQAGIANNGPGSRFEFLESLPVDERPTHFAYYPGWMGTHEYWGEVLMHTTLRRGIEGRRLAGDSDMQIIVADWDHVHTGERPLNDHPGWKMVDRVDIADMASERAHHWVGKMGRRKLGDPTARWSITEKEPLNGLTIDGGRTIREGGETFTVFLDPNKPTRLIIRTGGQPSYGWHETLTKPIQMAVYAGAKKLGELTVAPPNGVFSELTFNIPPHALPSTASTIRIQASGMYRVFHWFVLQPE
jgi:hypothetical protein